MSELYNPHYEQSVIGAILCDAPLINDVAALVTAESFYDVDCRRVFTAMQDLLDAGQPIDFMTVADRLEALYPSSEPWLTKTMTLAAHTLGANVEEYAKAVAGYAMLRKLHGAGQEVCRSCFDPALDLQEKIAKAQQAVTDVVRISGPRGPKQAIHAAREWWASMELAAESESGILGLSTGFHGVDQRVLGLSRGEMIVLAGRPGAGKTAFALNIAMNVVNRGGLVLFFSLEMAAREQIGRIASAETGIPYEDILRGRMTGDNQRVLNSFVAKIRDMPLHIDDDACVHINDIRARSRALAQKNNIDLIVIDYLQLANGDGKSKYEKVTDVSRGIKLLAREIDCPVMALSQLNRSGATRADKTPDLSDLRDSGAIEQDADSVWFLHPHPEEKVELIIGKLRKGKIGSEWFDKRLDIMRLVPGAPYYAPPTEKPFAQKRRAMDL